MKTLKSVKKTVNSVDHFDLEDFVRDIYNVDYEFVAVQECGNYSEHEFNVTGEVSDLDKENWQRYLKQGFIPVYRNNLLLNIMASENLIEKGIYLIYVSW